MSWDCFVNIKCNFCLSVGLTYTQYSTCTVHLHDNECDKKVKDFTSDDILKDPDNPLRTRDRLQLVYPDFNHTEGIVETPKRTTLLWGSQATEQDKMDKTKLGIGLVKFVYW